jgi:hypothetical protein
MLASSGNTGIGEDDGMTPHSTARTVRVRSDTDKRNVSGGKGRFNQPEHSVQDETFSEDTGRYSIGLAIGVGRRPQISAGRVELRPPCAGSG